MRDIDDMQNKLTAKEENLRVLKIELEQKSAQLREVCAEYLSRDYCLT